MAGRIWQRRAGLIWAGLVLAALLAISGWILAITWRPAAADFPVQGADLSQADAVTDWNTLAAAHVDFVYLRATYASEGRDARFGEYWAAAYGAGLRRGAYHQFSLCRLAIDQANNFVTTVPRTGDALPAALLLDFAGDCKTRPDRAVVIGEIERFLAIVETHTGKPALLMVSQSFDEAYDVSSAIHRTLWLSRPYFPPDYGARGWTMWQASRMRQVEGVEGRVHWNVVAR